MAKVKLSGTLPKGMANGLSALAERLARMPRETQFIVATVAPKTMTVDLFGGGEPEYELIILTIEGVLDTDDRSKLTRMLERAAEQRRGRNPDQLDGLDLTGEQTQ
jgi:hypothetical protein